MQTQTSSLHPLISCASLRNGAVESLFGTLTSRVLTVLSHIKQKKFPVNKDNPSIGLFYDEYSNPCVRVATQDLQQHIYTSPSLRTLNRNNNFMRAIGLVHTFEAEGQYSNIRTLSYLTYPTLQEFWLAVGASNPSQVKEELREVRKFTNQGLNPDLEMVYPDTHPLQGKKVFSFLPIALNILRNINESPSKNAEFYKLSAFNMDILQNPKYIPENVESFYIPKNVINSTLAPTDKDIKALLKLKTKKGSKKTLEKKKLALPVLDKPVRCNPAQNTPPSVKKVKTTSPKKTSVGAKLKFNLDDFEVPSLGFLKYKKVVEVPETDISAGETPNKSTSFCDSESDILSVSIINSKAEKQKIKNKSKGLQKASLFSGSPQKDYKEKSGPRTELKAPTEVKGPNVKMEVKGPNVETVLPSSNIPPTPLLPSLLPVGEVEVHLSALKGVEKKLSVGSVLPSECLTPHDMKYHITISGVTIYPSNSKERFYWSGLGEQVSHLDTILRSLKKVEKGFTKGKDAEFASLVGSTIEGLFITRGLIMGIIMAKDTARITEGTLTLKDAISKGMNMQMVANSHKAAKKAKAQEQILEGAAEEGYGVGDSTPEGKTITYVDLHKDEYRELMSYFSKYYKGAKGGVPHQFTNQERGQSKMLMNYYGKDCLTVVGWLLNNWSEVLHSAGSYGVYKPAGISTIGFLLYARAALLEFYKAKSKEMALYPSSEATIASNTLDASSPLSNGLMPTQSPSKPVVEVNNYNWEYLSSIAGKSLLFVCVMYETKYMTVDMPSYKAYIDLHISYYGVGGKYASPSSPLSAEDDKLLKESLTALWIATKEKIQLLKEAQPTPKKNMFNW